MATEPTSSSFAPGGASNAGEKLSAAASDARARAENIGRSAADIADQARPTSAAGLSAAGGAIDDNADEVADGVRRVAHRTAKAISTGADYIRDNSVQQMVDDAMTVVKNNPGVTLLGAVAIGFLVGRAFSSRN